MVIACSIISGAQQKPPLQLLHTTPLPELQEGDFDHFAVDLAGNRLFCTAEANGKVLIFDLKTNQLLHTIPDLKLPHSLIYRSDLKKLFVIDGGLGEIRIFDAASYQPTGTIKLRPGAGPMAYDSSTRYLYVMSGGRDGDMPESYLNVVDTTSGKILAEAKMSSNDVEALLLEKSGPRLFVDVRGSNTIDVLDRGTRKVLASWPLAQVAKKPAKMAFDEADHRLFIGARDPAKLVVLNSDSGAVVTTLPGAPMVDDMVFDRQSKRIYFAGSDFVDIFAQLHPDRYQLVGHVPTALRAKTALLVPELSRYYVAVPRNGSQPAELRVFQVVP